MLQFLLIKVDFSVPYRTNVPFSLFFFLRKDATVEKRTPGFSTHIFQTHYLKRACFSGPDVHLSL